MKTDTKKDQPLPKRLKILVFDDKQLHRDAAKAQLKDHDVTIVATYNEAHKALQANCDRDRAKQMFSEKYGDDDPYDSLVGKALRIERTAFYESALDQATTHPDFDVFLTDLLVPASDREQGREGRRYVGEEMPVGVFIGLLAAVEGVVKYVAVFTDSNHHHHPASACLDAFGSGPIHKPFQVNGCKVIFSNAAYLITEFDPNDLSKKVDISEGNGGKLRHLSHNDQLRIMTSEGKAVTTKNWAGLLKCLLKDKEE